MMKGTHARVNPIKIAYVAGNMARQRVRASNFDRYPAIFADINLHCFQVCGFHGADDDHR